MAEELSGQWVGPMPVEDFIHTFVQLPEGVTTGSMPDFEDDFFSTLTNETDENAVYDSFMEKVTNSGSLPGFQLVKTAFNSDPNTPVRRKGKPDISVYKQDLDVGSRLIRFKSMELLFEFKPHNAAADPFEDNPKDKNGVLCSFEADSTDDDAHGLRKKCRRQIVSYATTWCSRQHRTHCFILWLGDPDARIIRFDSSGATVSAKFNYSTQSNLLLGFLWRFSMASDEVRGHDTTISIASPEESKVAKAALKEWSIWKPATDKSILKMQIPDATTLGTRTVFVSKPHANPLSLTGRAARGYLGWDPLGNDGKGAAVLVKDYWRSCEEGMEKETEILRELNEHCCRNVPMLICGDDIPNQSTLTKKYACASWNLGGQPDEIVQRNHIRLAQNFIGISLNTFETSREFVVAVFDALIAHKDAYEKCNILHCNVSASNIIMREECGGVLDTWDYAKRIPKDPKTDQRSRLGSWRFMSAALLLDSEKTNTVQDDMESFFWVVLYHILRYMNHTRVEDAKYIITDIFDEEHVGLSPTHSICGGRNKKSYFFTFWDHLGDDFNLEGNYPIKYLMTILRRPWTDWYDRINETRQKVRDAVCFEGLSLEEATKCHPFDPQDLAMRNYDFMIETFEKVLAMTTWPLDDAACDHLPEERPVKKLRTS